MRVTDESKKKFWQEHISACSKSKLGIRQYCRAEGINHNTFYYWRCRTGVNPEPKPLNKPSAFLPVTLKEKPRPVSFSSPNFEDPVWLGRFTAELIRGLR